MTAPDDRPTGASLPIWLQPLRVIGRFVLTIVLILYTLLDELLFPLLRPLLTVLGQLRVFELFGAGIARLPPYLALVALAVPFVIIEPVKVFAIYWTGTGHWIQGSVLLVSAHVLSILVVDRIYHAGHAPLMRIGWFKRLMTWLAGLRRRGVDWAKSTLLWQASARFARSLRATVSGWFRTSL
jgi:hypothetical protein